MISRSVAVYYARAYAKARKNTVQVLRKRIEVMATIVLVHIMGEDYVAFLLAFLEELISYESPRRIKFCSTTCFILDRGEDQNVSDSHDARIEEATIAIATASGEGGLCRKEGVEETSWGSQRIFSAVRVIFSKRLRYVNECMTGRICRLH